MIMAASSINEEQDYWNSIPRGFHFEPLDEELITHYLIPKVKGHPLPPNKIHTVHLYGEHDPWVLGGNFYPVFRVRY